ncbi:MAG TPA: hypothetical protein VN325_23185 [Steroidobacteraceae bacterium]|nr:hypothetical protein [Steroidobacteraceae bacterium]
MKLDKKFYADVVYIRKAKDHSIVPDDEWVVFLAKDNAFAAVLPAYRRELIAMGADDEQLEAVTRLIDDVTAWRLANPERCKVPDAKGEKLLP